MCNAQLLGVGRCKGERQDKLCLRKIKLLLRRSEETTPAFRHVKPSFQGQEPLEALICCGATEQVCANSQH